MNDNERLKQELKINKIREMKCPTIIMNENDFKEFKTENLLGNNHTFEGIPIKTTHLIEKGVFLIYDYYNIPYS